MIKSIPKIKDRVQITLIPVKNTEEKTKEEKQDDKKPS
jgi:hypothetical protein